MNNDFEAELKPKIVVVDLRSSGPSAFTDRIIQHDPKDPTFEALTLRTVLDKKFPKHQYDAVKLVVFIEDASKPRDQKTIDQIRKLFKNTDRWMTHKYWQDERGLRSTQEDTYFDNERVGEVRSTGGIDDYYEILNLVTQAKGVAEVRQVFYDFYSAEDEFNELFIAKRDNDPTYPAKLDAFINKHSSNLGRYAFPDILIPRLLHSLKNESTDVRQQAKSILSAINREYLTSFTVDGLSREWVAQRQAADPNYVPKYATPGPAVEPTTAVESNPESPKRGSPTLFGKVQPTAGLERDERFERKRVRPAESADAAKPAEPTRPKVAAAPAPAPTAAAAAPKAAAKDEPKKGGIPNAFKSAISRLRGKDAKEPDEDRTYKGPKK